MSMQFQRDSRQNSLPGTNTESSTAAAPPMGKRDTIEMEAEDIRVFLPATMMQMPEYASIMSDGQVMETGSKPKLFSIPDVTNLFESTLSAIQKDFSQKTVFLELQNLYQLLVLSRNNEKSMTNKLSKCEDEIERLNARLQRDPRLLRTLVLAESWREQKAETEQMCPTFRVQRQQMLPSPVTVQDQLYGEAGKLRQTATFFKYALNTVMALNMVKQDMKVLESKIHSLQLFNGKLQKECHKYEECKIVAQHLEEAIAGKDNLISELSTRLDQSKRRSKSVDFGKERVVQEKKDTRRESQCWQALEAEQKLSNDKTSIILAKSQKIETLETKVDDYVRLEGTANRNYRTLALSMNVLKYHTKMVERAIEEANRKYDRQTFVLNQKDKKIDILEQIVQQGKLNQKSMKQVLVKLSAKNDQLKSLLRSRTLLAKRLAVECFNKKMTLRDKDIEADVSIRYGAKLSTELRFVLLKLQESLRQTEQATGTVDIARQTLTAQGHALDEAVISNSSLLKSLDFTQNSLQTLKSNFERCKRNNMEINHTVMHLQSVCRENETTMRIKDATNDSLVVNVSNLKDLLTYAHLNAHRLRQLNLIAKDHNRRQLELNELGVQLIKFIEAENKSAFAEYSTAAATVVILQKEQVRRLGTFAGLCREITDLKSTLSKQVDLVDIQKKEAIIVRDKLNKAKKEETFMKLTISSLTGERDTFGSMVILRNVHIGLLQKKVKLLIEIIDRGTAAFRLHSIDLRILKLEIKNLRRKVRGKDSIIVANNKLRCGLVNAHRELLMEQNKLKRMEDLKFNGIHRYSNVKASDPSEYERIMKIHTLQKRLIRKTDEIVRKDEIICKKDVALRSMLLYRLFRQENTAANKLRECKAVVAQKNKQIKGLLSEINVLTYDFGESKAKLEALRKSSRDETAKYKLDIVEMPSSQVPSIPAIKTKVPKDSIIWNKSFQPLSILRQGSQPQKVQVIKGIKRASTAKATRDAKSGSLHKSALSTDNVFAAAFKPGRVVFLNETNTSV